MESPGVLHRTESGLGTTLQEGLRTRDLYWTTSVLMHQQPLCSEGSSYSLLVGFGGLFSSKHVILSILLPI